MDRHSPAYHLVRPRARAAGAPVLDEAQQAVVEHSGGPLLVLAGPGNRKTPAIVETGVNRRTGPGNDPERGLALPSTPAAARGPERADRRPAGPPPRRPAGHDLPQLRLRLGAQGVRAGR